LGQGGQQTAIDRSQVFQGLGFFAGDDGHRLLSQFTDDVMKEFGVKDATGLTEGTQGGAGTAQELLHLGQLTGLLEGAQALADGIEEEEQEEAGVLIEVELAVASAIPCGRVVLEACQERHQEPEILEALEGVLGQQGSPLLHHGVFSGDRPAKVAGFSPWKNRQLLLCQASKKPKGECNFPTTGSGRLREARFVPNSIGGTPCGAWPTVPTGSAWSLTRMAACASGSWRQG